MNYNGFEALRKKAAQMPPKIIAVAAAHDEEIIITVAEAYKKGIADFILVGDEKRIAELAQKSEVKFDFAVIDERDEKEAALKAAELVRTGKADVLMKGLLNSSVFLKAVLDENRGLKTGKLLSHLAAFEIPTCAKLAFHTDGGMNTFPNLESKKQILANALAALNKLGIVEPKVAVLAANELVSEKMPSTVDAAALVAAVQRGELPSCRIEGPVAMDVALSKEAARHKGIASKISGEVDLFVMPNIEAGNMVGKTLLYAAGAKMAGVILGGTKPVVMTSRAENAEGKLNSILLASLVS